MAPCLTYLLLQNSDPDDAIQITQFLYCFLIYFTVDIEHTVGIAALRLVGHVFDVDLITGEYRHDLCQHARQVLMDERYFFGEDRGETGL